MTDNLCRTWEIMNFTLKDIKIYTRAVKGSSAYGAGAVGGICHTFMIIKSESDIYILERLQEGVRLSNIGIDGEEKATKLSVCIVHSKEPISSAAVAKFIRQESKNNYL